MASMQIVRSGYSQLLCYSSEFGRKSSLLFSDSNSEAKTKRVIKFQRRRSLSFPLNRRFRVCCSLQEGNKENNGEEPPESLFMRELRKRGMNPTSLLEDNNRNIGLEEDIKVKEDDRVVLERNAVMTDVNISLSNQRERSMALNSEGLEGLIPRAKLLLTLGGTFFLGFGPLILITAAVFSGLYLYFGPTFVHDASKTPAGPPPYVDPYALLEDQRISQTAPSIK